MNCKRCGAGREYRSDGKLKACAECSRQRAAAYYREKVQPTLTELPLKIENRNRKAAAKARGDLHYISALPCKNGHIGKRLVSTQQCCECLKAGKPRNFTRAYAKKLAFVKRRTASNLGKTCYYTGLECGNGHLAERLVSTRQCLACLANRPAHKAPPPKNKQRANAKRRSRAGRARNRRYYQEKLSKRPEHKVTTFMRGCLRRCLADKDGARTFEVLGYSATELIEHLGRKFTDGMSWENYGEWHIDHIISISAFIKIKVFDPKIINALWNLQPLWAEENLIKGS